MRVVDFWGLWLNRVFRLVVFGIIEVKGRINRIVSIVFKDIE